jgi:cellulose synthase/poly-beta-1,6-N-acetylglucosamine synthase-like glycosyltransferase
LSTDQLVVLFLCIVSVYFLEHLFFSLGVWRARRASASRLLAMDSGEKDYPTVTVLVCARDEEENIDACVRSLAALNYPTDRIELLVVDDKSTDRTPDILRAWQQRLPNLTVYRTGPEVEHLRGKVNALTQGMDVATGEIVLITDADSTVNPEWARQYVSYYEQDTGLVASITLLDIRYFLDGVQSIDWAYLLGIAAASTNLKVPLSVIGNNMSVRKAAYESVGGYRKIPFSVTEDYALYQAIWHKPEWKVKFRVHPNLLVMSKACPNLKTWWHQKHRWVKGGQGLKALGWLIFILGFLGNLTMILAPIFLPAFAAILVIFAKWSADLLILVPVLTKLRMTRLLWYFPLYELYLFFFVVSIPAMVLKKNVVWKGRLYKH